MIDTRPIDWRGDSLDVLRSLSEDLQDDLGYMLHQVQAGITPSNFKPIPTVGNGVYELRASDAEGIGRVMYIAKYPEAVYVLHTFQKKTRKTSQKDIKKATVRLNEVIAERSAK